MEVQKAEIERDGEKEDLIIHIDYHRFNCTFMRNVYHPWSTQIQHKFNTNNEIWPKLTIFYQNYQHKLNTN